MQLRPGEPEEVGMSARRVRHVGQLAAGWVAQGITHDLEGYELNFACLKTFCL
jgi:hypothetical protein